MLVVFLVLLILPGSLMQTQPKAMSTVIFILTLALVGGTISLLIYTVSNLTSDFRKSTYRLERSTGRSYKLIFLIKLGFNVFYVLLSTLVVIIGRELISKFDTEHMRYFLIQLNRPYYVFVLEFAIFYPLSFLVVFLFIKNVCHSRYVTVYISLTAMILCWSASCWKENAVWYVVTLAILCVMMLCLATWLATERTVKT
jgi:hypothetical protein